MMDSPNTSVDKVLAPLIAELERMKKKEPRNYLALLEELRQVVRTISPTKVK